MPFYDLQKQQRVALVSKIHNDILTELGSTQIKKTLDYFGDADTYIRKSAYLTVGRIYFTHKELRQKIIKILDNFLLYDDFKIRQATINAAGEIGKKDFNVVELFFDKGLPDKHHSVRNAVIGSVKKMGEVNPVPVLHWAQKYLSHPDKEIRREICHGIELRGRKYPEDILPLLKKLQYDPTARVRNTLVHVIGQISYKKDCLETVVAHLKTWDNEKLVKEALLEIVDVHDRYKKFSALNQKEARRIVESNFSPNKKT